MTPVMKNLATIFLVLIFCATHNNSAAQETPITKKIIPFSLDTLVQATQLTNDALEKANSIIGDTASYLSVLETFENRLKSNPYLLENDSIFVDYNDFSISAFEQEGRYWISYEEELAELQVRTTEYVSNISKLVPELSLLRQRWKATRVPTGDSVVVSEAIIENIDNFALNIEKANKLLNVYLDAFLRLSARISHHQKQVNLAKAKFEEMVAATAKSVFIKDAPPLIEALRADSLSASQVIGKGWRIERDEFVSFTKVNYPAMLLHLALIIILMFFVNGLAKNSNLKEEQEDYLLNVQNAVIEKPFLSGLILGLFCTPLFYTGLPVLMINLLILAGAFPVTVLLPRIIRIKLSLLSPFLFILIMLSLVVGFSRNEVAYERLILLIAAIFMMAAMVYFAVQSSARKAIKQAGGSVILLITYVFITLLFISVIANLSGRSQLALLLSVGVIFSFTTGLIAFVSVKMSQAVLRMVVNSQIAQKLNSIRTNNQSILVWIVYLTTISGVIFLSRSVLSSFKILNAIQDKYGQFVAYTWSFGEASLSLQNIIDFVVILLIFYLISNLVQIIIQDELLPRFDLRKGLPLGMAILTRYVILFLGFVLAMSAAGISLSKLNLIIGALGVGIGFGLQNIVSNFVSGFVIIFERPLHIGDIIATGTIEGEVTAIGLRSSRIRTYDGAEVIVPNNNLVANEVVNWTYNDKRRRVERFVYVEGGTNPRHIKQIIDGVLTAHKGLIENGESEAFFLGFDNDALKFRVLMWMNAEYVKNPSEVLMDLYEALTSNGYKPYIPVQKVVLSEHQVSSGKIIGNNPDLNMPIGDAGN